MHARFRFAVAAGLGASLALPHWAHAQFTVQSESVYASAETASSKDVMASQPGDLGSLSVSASSESFGLIGASSGASTTVSSTQVGISLGTSANWTGPTANGFASGDGYWRTPSSGFIGGGSGAPYSGYEVTYLGMASAVAKAQVVFDVASSTDVTMFVRDGYQNMTTPGVSFTSELNLYKLDAADTWTRLVWRQQIEALTHLEAGVYKLDAQFKYTLGAPSGLSGGGASVMITAVPEPGTWALFGLGLMGMGCAVRRRAHA